ncbi:uncharacterized protein LOC5564425 [Aedes aegypti]|uniref:CHK kinase-like domain-containing protein n=1 Tax=Aedes aegypti TaxID=7159 RepID=A0A1S4G1Y5_AEDAE|nr:uncharacterized protein LOC5564425 [Aedes aegypti]
MSSTSEIIVCDGDVDGWRNLNFFRDVVSKDLNLQEKEFHLYNLNITTTEKQSGFTSLLYRVKVNVELNDGKRDQRMYVVKEISKDAYGGDTMDTYNLFHKEIKAYQELIPEFEKLFQNKVRFGPRFLKAVTTPFTVIVLEDLNASGYQMKNCSKRLDISQSKTVLSRLAKFHAASAVYFKQNGPYPTSFKTGMYDEESALNSETYIGNLFKALESSLRERNCSRQYLDLISQWGTNPYVSGAKLFRLNDQDFTVLNHGDLWMNNVMFSDSDLLLIDFQIAFYGSFTFDVLEFIFCTVKVDDIIHKFDDLIEFYHQELRTAFQILDNSSMLPSLETLQADIKRHGFLAGLLMIEAIPMITFVNVGEMSMDLMSSAEPEGEEFRRKLFHNEKFIEVVDQLLPFLHERGYLKCSINE